MEGEGREWKGEGRGAIIKKYKNFIHIIFSLLSIGYQQLLRDLGSLIFH